jgi:hypothetical protein
LKNHTFSWFLIYSLQANLGNPRYVQETWQIKHVEQIEKCYDSAFALNIECSEKLVIKTSRVKKVCMLHAMSSA